MDIDSNDSITFYYRGRVLYFLSRNEEALASYNKSIEINPNYADANNGKGNVLKALNRKKEALACFNKVLQIDPNNEYALNRRRILLNKN